VAVSHNGIWPLRADSLPHQKRITDLIEQHHPGPRELTFLSACQTATGSARALDERHTPCRRNATIGLPPRNRHPPWSIHDSPAPDIADTVYTTTGTPTADHA
jgi:hypothetical protein